MLAKYLSCFCRKQRATKHDNKVNHALESMNVRVTENNTDSLCSEYSVDIRDSFKNYKCNPN